MEFEIPEILRCLDPASKRRTNYVLMLCPSLPSLPTIPVFFRLDGRIFPPQQNVNERLVNVLRKI